MCSPDMHSLPWAGEAFGVNLCVLAHRLRWASSRLYRHLCCYGLKVTQPSTCYRSHSSILCCKRAAAIPLADLVPAVSCGFCCLRLVPTPYGFLAPPTYGAPAPISSMWRT